MCSVLAETFCTSRFELIEELVTRGYKLILLAPDKFDDFNEKFDKNKVEYIQISLDRTGMNPLKDYATIKEIEKIIEEHNPQITYGFGGAKAAIYTVIAASRKKINNNYCMINGLGSIFRGVGLKNKFIEIIMSKLFKYALEKANGILVQNPDDLKDLLKITNLKQDKFKRIYGSGVNLDRFPKEKLVNNNVFLFVGRLLKDKGILEFLMAAEKVKSKFPEAEFWVVGEVDANPSTLDKDEIQKWVDKNIISYFGRQNNVVEFYKDCTAFVLPSYHEGTPRTSLEAMGTGRAIITTDVPGCRETVEEKVNGFLIPSHNVSLLVDRIEILLKNPNLAQKMGENSYLIAVEKYDVKSVNNEIIEFITKY